MIELRTLGALRLRDARGRDLCGELQPKRLALLIYLAQAPRHFHRRDSLLALFWPELDFEGGRNTLRQALYALRRTLGHGVLEAHGYEEIALADSVWSDVAAFESALERDELEAALDIYGGDLLQGFHVQNVAPDFEHWLETERLRLRILAVGAAVSLRDREEASGNLAAAVRWGHAAWRLDPGNEGVLAGLIDLLVRVGDRAGAVRAYEVFARRALEEYDLAPSEETRALIEAVRSDGETNGKPADRQPGIAEPLTRFVGRGRLLDELEGVLLDPATRLLTLTGLGGAGKTRVALELARLLEGRFADGVARIGLGDTLETRGVLPVIARAVGFSEKTPQRLTEGLHDHLADKQILIVLDGFERFADSAPEILALLQAAPRVKILVTSRVRLRMRGEREVPVPPLTLPRTQPGPSVEFPLNSEAVALFVDRARAARHDFALSAANMEAVAEICRRLDGLPLAIELAAARVRSLTPQSIATHLEDRFAFLTGGFVDLPPGQRTLEETIAWSHALLGDDECALFRRLGVFVGGFGLELAEPYFEEWDLPSVELIDGLASLVDLGLVRQLEANGEPRFAMPDSVRAYTRKLLAESDEEECCRVRHAEVVLASVEEGERHYCEADQDEWLRRLERDHDNVRAAIGWALDGSDAAIAVRLGAALWPFWCFQGYLAEADGWLGRMLTVESPAPGHEVARGKALLGACWIALSMARYAEAIARAKESVALFAEHGDEAGYVRALETLGFAHFEVGELEPADPIFEECLAKSRESGDERRQAIALNALGQVAGARGDLPRAEELFLESIGVARGAGLEPSVGQGLLRLGDVARRRGAPGEALPLYEEAFDTFCVLGQKVHVACALSSIGSALVESGRAADAREKFTESLEIFHDIGYGAGTARALIGIAGIALSRGDAERGAKLLGAIHELVDGGGHRLQPDDADAFESLQAAARKKLREPAFTARWSEGAAMDAAAVLALAKGDGSGVRHRAIG